MTTTTHSLIRAKQRIGCNEKSAKHQFTNALLRGKTPADYKGLERHFLIERMKGGCDIRVYNGYIYVISKGDIIVTLYGIPSWFGKTGKKYASKRASYHDKEMIV